ncbi:hypothetical protein [Rufibacter soli]
MMKPNLPLLLARGIVTQNNIILEGDIEGDNAQFINQLLASQGRLPQNSPYEIHPYKNLLPLSNHTKYIIGTFPPVSYILDHPQIAAANIDVLRQPVNGAGVRVVRRPWVPFYHGNRKAGSMWLTMLSSEELDALQECLEMNGRLSGRQFLINTLISAEVNYADVIDAMQRSLVNGKYTSSDICLNNIKANDDLISHILANPNTQSLLFNTSSIFSNSGVDLVGTYVSIDNPTAFDLFVRRCQDLGMQVEVQIQSGDPDKYFTWRAISELNEVQRKTKVAFEMALINPESNVEPILEMFLPGERKEFTVVTPFSPAAVNRGSLNRNLVVQNWRNATGGDKGDLLKIIYQCFLEGDMVQIYNLNV